MNKFPIVEMLALYSRYERIENPCWRKAYLKQVKRIRSCHSKIDGGVKKSFYSAETRSGEIIDLVYNEEELLWTLEPSGLFRNHVVDKVLALIKRHKHTPSRAHRIIPYRFEIIPQTRVEKIRGETELPLSYRVQPYRFQSGKLPSTQVINIITRHDENMMTTHHLHYVMETDQHRFMHLVYILNESDWRFMQEVDGEFFFDRRSK